MAEEWLQAARPPSASWYPTQTRQRVGRFDCRSRARQFAQDPGSSQLQASGLRTLGWPHCSIQGFPRGLSTPAAHALACALWGSFWPRRAVSEMRQVGRTPSKQRKSEAGNERRRPERVGSTDGLGTHCGGYARRVACPRDLSALGRPPTPYRDDK